MTCPSCFPTGNQRALERTAHIQCATCSVRGDQWDACPATGDDRVPLTIRTSCGVQRLNPDLVCPLGRHPDREGRVRVGGMMHWGVPMLTRLVYYPAWAMEPLADEWRIRRWVRRRLLPWCDNRWGWRMRRRRGLVPLTGPIPGCGCTVRGKAAWRRVRAAAPLPKVTFAPESG